MSKRFNINECSIPRPYCGLGKIPKSNDPLKRYVRKGNSYECLKAGIGVGSYKERIKNLPLSSLQRIKYIGPIYEARFKTYGILTIKSLLLKARSGELEKIISKVLKRKNKGIDEKAHNSILVYLYQNGIDSHILPPCIKL